MCKIALSIATAALVAAGCGRPSEATVTDAGVTGLQRQITSSVSNYFEGRALARVADCWSRIEGEGEVTIAYDVQPALMGEPFAVVGVGIAESTLPEAATEAAAACMRELVGDVVLADIADPTGVLADGLRLFWTWSVPMASRQVQPVSASRIKQINREYEALAEEIAGDFMQEMMAPDEEVGDGACEP